MSEYLKKFSIEDVQMYNEQKENIDFSIVEIWTVANDNNSHRNPISIEVLEKYADTFKGKFIVAKFDKTAMDVKAHETDEIIVGYIDPREPIEFKTKFVETKLKFYRYRNRDTNISGWRTLLENQQSTGNSRETGHLYLWHCER